MTFVVTVADQHANQQPKETLPIRLSADQQFKAWMDANTNLHAPAINAEDYIAASKRLALGEIWIRTIFTVEAPNSGYENDGTLKALLERHVLKRNINVFTQAQQKAISRALGPELVNSSRGGYKGGKAEWWRIRNAAVGIADIVGDFEQALEVVLRATSFGRPQIMGFNFETAGFDSAKAMVDAMAAKESAHLDAFCSHLEKTGLVQHLRDAEVASDPYPPLKRFALGYNGKMCCVLGAKRNYVAEAMAVYRRLSGNKVDLKPIAKSRIVRGTGLATTATGLIAPPALTELYLYITTISNKVTDVKAQADTILSSVGGIKTQVSTLIADNAEVLSQLNGLTMWMYILGGILLMSLLGNMYALYARWDDARRGLR